MNNNIYDLSTEEKEKILRTLKQRFEKNMNRHKNLEWNKIRVKLEANDEKLWSLNEMERTFGEPDVIYYDKKMMNILFMIVRWKALLVVEIFVTIVRHWSQERKISRKIILLIWRLKWV